jgi:tetratricopeptide (TPR) repeat protein
MRKIQLPGVVPRPRSRLDTPRRLLLGGCLLVLAISGCTVGSQGHVSLQDPVASQSGVSPHDPEQSDYVRASDTYCDRSQPAQAIACYQRALAATYHQRTKGSLLLHLGRAYYELGQFTTAMAFSEEALAIARQERSRTLEGRALQRLGIISMALGRWTDAVVSLEQALAIRRGLVTGRTKGPCSSIWAVPMPA